MRRPYRVFLPSRMRRATFATARRAVRACEDDGPGIYVVEWASPEGPHLPLLIVHVDDRKVRQQLWQHLKADQQGASA